MTEEWKDIPGFPGYEASSLGRIRSWLIANGRPGRSAHPRILKPGPGRSGGKKVTLVRSNGPRRSAPVHQLVLEAFVGPRPAGMECCHFPDRDRSNNRLSNIRWDTKLANAADREIHGTTARGEKNGAHTKPWRRASGKRQGAYTKPECVLRGSRHGRSLVNENDVRDIRAARAAGEKLRRIAEKYGVHVSTIHLICKRRNWGHVA